MIDLALPDEAATRRAGAALGALLAAGDAVALIGELGAGKTTLVQAIAAGAGVTGPVTSPTFTLINEHHGSRVPIAHVDLYRLERARELDELGLDELLRGGVFAVLIEWADRFPVMPPDHLRIELTDDGDARCLVARGTGPRGEALAAAWAAELDGQAGPRSVGCASRASCDSLRAGGEASMSNERESERVTSLKTVTAPPSQACRNTFDTTALALTDMEQPNIAYGRNYVRLEIEAGDFLAMPAPTDLEATRVPRMEPAPTAVRLGAETATTRLDRVRARSMATLRTADGFVPRDPIDAMSPTSKNGDAGGATVSVAGHHLPIVKATSLGIRELVGWVTLPLDGVVAEPPAIVPPALYVVQRYRLATYARGFGLGDHLYSFTLFPEEEVEIEIKTWKSQEQVDKTGSSIFDGRSDSAESDFENTVQQENSRASKKDKAFEAHVEASGEASWGWGSASVQAGATTSTAESTEQFAKDTSSATQKIANKANRERRVEVTQSSEVKTTEGEETRTKRKIRNINKCNTLNFNYFQLIRKYETRLELYDIKIRYASGIPSFDDADDAWHYDAEEASLAELNRLLERTLAPIATAGVKSAMFGMLGPGDADDPGLDVLTASSTPERMRLDVVPLSTMIAWEDAARAAARNSLPAPPMPTAKIPRLMSRDERVIATNAIYADAMLGKCSAGDDFIQDSRVLEIEGRQLENRERELGIARAKAELAHFQLDPVPRRIVEVAGLPDAATVHVHVRDTSDGPTHAVKADVEPDGGS